MSCSVLGSLQRRAAAGVTLLPPVEDLRSGRKEFCPLSHPRKQQTVFHGCPFTTACVSMVLGEPWCRSAEGTSTSVPHCHPALLLGPCWAVRSPCGGRNWGDNHSWHSLSTYRSSRLWRCQSYFCFALSSGNTRTLWSRVCSFGWSTRYWLLKTGKKISAEECAPFANTQAELLELR